MIPIHVLQPNTWIRCTGTSFYHDYQEGKEILFMGWISNPKGGHDALAMDDRGVFTISIHEEGWEIV